MSNTPGETPIFSIKDELTQEQLAELAEERRDRRHENSGGHAPGDLDRTDLPKTKPPEAAPTSTTPEATEDLDEGPISIMDAQVAIDAIRHGVEPSKLMPVKRTLENAIEDDEGNIKADYSGVNGPVGIDPEDDTDEEDADDQESEDDSDSDPEPDAEARVDGLSTDTFLPNNIGLVGAIEDEEGEVKPNYSDPLNGARAA